MRQVTAQHQSKFRRSCAGVTFKKFRVQTECNTHDARAAAAFKVAFMRRRDKVVEIVSIGGGMFTVLLGNGVCGAFRIRDGRRVCYLNINSNEIVRSMFYNKRSNDIITVCVDIREGFNTLRCRATPVDAIRKGTPKAGYELFKHENMKWPGFVEFDELNEKVLTFDVETGMYSLWALQDYRLLYKVSSANVNEMKMSKGVLLQVMKNPPGAHYITLRLLDVDTGRLQKEFVHLLQRGRSLDFVEVFNNKILIKQEGCDMNVIDVKTNEVSQVSRAAFPTPAAFLFLYGTPLYLTFRGHDVTAWDYNGKLVTRFENHTLWHTDCNTSNLHVTSKQDFVVSFCQSKTGKPTVNVSDIRTGKSVAVLGSGLRAADIQRQLRSVTALFFDEESNLLFTGNKQGRVKVWGRG